MNNKTLPAEFTRVKATPDGLRVECQVISWPHPSRPSSRWKQVKTLPPDSTAEEIGAARRLLLQDPRFFNVCKMCHERLLMGYMCHNRVCQGCAAGRLGVVF